MHHVCRPRRRLLSNLIFLKQRRFVNNFKPSKSAVDQERLQHPTEMSRTTKRKHVYNELLQSELRVPKHDQEIVKVIAGRGNNLHEVQTSSAETFLVSMPQKFRRNVWIKRGDFVLVERIPEGDKVRAEIVTVLTKDHIRYYKNQNCWPENFNQSSDQDITTGNRPPGFEHSSSSSSSDEEYF